MQKIAQFKTNYNIAYEWTQATGSGIEKDGSDFIGTCKLRFKYWTEIESIFGDCAGAKPISNSDHKNSLELSTSDSGSESNEECDGNNDIEKNVSSHDSDSDYNDADDGDNDDYDDGDGGNETNKVLVNMTGDDAANPTDKVDGSLNKTVCSEKRKRTMLQERKRKKQVRK